MPKPPGSIPSSSVPASSPAGGNRVLPATTTVKARRVHDSTGIASSSAAQPNTRTSWMRGAPGPYSKGSTFESRHPAGSARQFDPQNQTRFRPARQQALDERHDDELQAVLAANHAGQALDRCRLADHFGGPIHRLSAVADLSATATWHQCDPGVVLGSLRLPAVRRRPDEEVILVAANPHRRGDRGAVVLEGRQ